MFKGTLSFTIIKFNKTDEKKTLKHVPSVQRHTSRLLENQYITSFIPPKCSRVRRFLIWAVFVDTHSAYHDSTLKFGILMSKIVNVKLTTI